MHSFQNCTIRSSDSQRVDFLRRRVLRSIAASAIGFSEYFVRAYPQLLIWGDPRLSKKTLSICVICSLREFICGDLSSRTDSKCPDYAESDAHRLFDPRRPFARSGVSITSLKEARCHFLPGMENSGLSLMWIMFAYSDGTPRPTSARKFGTQQKTFPGRSFGAGVVMLLYICLNIVFVYAVPPEEMKGVISIGGLAMGSLWPFCRDHLSLLISFALFSSLSASSFLDPRVYYSMARIGYSLGLAHVHRDSKFPPDRLPCRGHFFCHGVLWNIRPDLDRDGICTRHLSLFTVAGVFRLRSSGTTSTMFSGYPWAPVIYLATGVCILLLAFFQRPTESSIAILSVLIGVPVYFYSRKNPLI